MRAHPLLAGLLVLASSCSAPTLKHEPWQVFQAGQIGLRDVQPLFTVYRMEGEFTGPTVSGGTQPTPPGLIESKTESDSEPLEAKFGHGLELELMLSADWSAGIGAEYRKFDLDDFGPPGLALSGAPIPVVLGDLESFQYSLWLRRYLIPFESMPRLRPFLGLSLDWIPKVESDVSLDFSQVAGGQLVLPPASFEGEDLVLARLLLGMAYQWRDRLVLQAGLSFERPLSPLSGSIEQPFNEELGSILIETEFEPRGAIGFVGLTYYP
ncbi:MAG: hypothetical protein VYE81_06595 [Planctomycetota bacterium]|nr:hypothetical protein [Planctomycetota bacterium]